LGNAKKIEWRHCEVKQTPIVGDLIGHDSPVDPATSDLHSGSAIPQAACKKTDADGSQMRDGIALAADLYRRAESSGPTAVLLLRTPYNKGTFQSQAERFAEGGYAVVAQDCRGRNGSDGTFGLYFADGQDGYDRLTGSSDW
jgi:hypothetical protein